MTIRKVGYLAGVFDFCHKGHVSIITRSLELCDKLVVAVVSDNYARKYKKQEIFHDENERLNVLQRLNMDLALVIVDNNEHEPFFNEFSITHLFHGTDWEKDQYIDFMGRDAIQKNGIEVVMLPHTKGISSTSLRNLQIERKTINKTEEEKA